MKFLNKKVNDCVQHIILQKFTNFHTIRSWSFENICNEIGWPRFLSHHVYTVNHEKRATLFLIITLAFLGRFLYILHQWKQEGILYKQVNKIYHFTLTVSPHYLVKLKPRINSTFWSQSPQCVRLNRLFATFAESCPMFVFSILLVGSSFISLLAEKFPHS